MRRRTYGLLVGVAIVMGVTAIVASLLLDEPLQDPDGFLGPAWVRMPAMVLGAFVIDVLPRSVWRSRRRFRDFPTRAAELAREHWTKDRIALVVIGLTAFYVTYVSYRNLKNYLPRMFSTMQDPVLHRLDKLLAFGNEPAVLMHNVLGDSIAAHVLAFVYLAFLPIAPLSLVVWLVWAPNISHGYWYATANCLCWAFGTISYYAIPTMGPNFWYPWLYKDLDMTGVTSLQNSLWLTRTDVTSDSIQSVAGFASLHVGIILTIALVAHHTVRSAVIRWTLWVFFALTVLSTLYFGWHYIADDIAGVAIAVAAVWIGGLATGQRFSHYGLRSHSTTETAELPAKRPEHVTVGEI